MTRLLLVLAATLLLAACQRAVFEHPPAVAQCDPQLVGHWLSKDANGGDDGEMRVEIAGDCQMRTIEQRPDGLRTSDTTLLGTGKLRRDRILWVDAGWAHRSYEIDPGPLDQDGDVYVYAYKIRAGDRLALYPVDSRRLARRAVDKKIEADVLLQDGSLTVRARGDLEQQRKQLPGRGLFDRSEPLEFARTTVDTAPEGQR